MEVKLVDDGDPRHLTMPKGDEESRLVALLFEKATELYPNWEMGDRTDLAMAMLAVVKTWAHQNDMTRVPHIDTSGISQRILDMATDEIDDGIN